MIHHATGPAVTSVNREQAVQEVRSHPFVPDTAEIEVWDERGQWVAAWHENNWKHSEFPPAGPKDDEEEAPSPKHESPEGGGDEGPPSDDGPSDEGGDEGPPKEHGDGPPGEHGKGGEGHQIHELMAIVQQIATALGITPIGPAGEGPGPGEEGLAPPPPGPPMPPHGHGGPEGPDQTVQHQKAMKPGEAPPGTTPVGAPAFASVIPENHPWQAQIGKSASFTVDSDPIAEDAPLAPISSELERVAYGTGFKLKQITEARDEDGQRVARALLSRW